MPEAVCRALPSCILESGCLDIRAYFLPQTRTRLPIRYSTRHLADIYTAKAVLNTWIKSPTCIVVGHGALSHFQ